MEIPLNGTVSCGVRFRGIAFEIGKHLGKVFAVKWSPKINALSRIYLGMSTPKPFRGSRFELLDMFHYQVSVMKYDGKSLIETGRHLLKALCR